MNIEALVSSKKELNEKTNEAHEALEEIHKVDSSPHFKDAITNAEVITKDHLEKMNYQIKELKEHGEQAKDEMLVAWSKVQELMRRCNLDSESGMTEIKDKIIVTIKTLSDYGLILSKEDVEKYTILDGIIDMVDAVQTALDEKNKYDMSTQEENIGQGLSKISLEQYYRGAYSLEIRTSVGVQNSMHDKIKALEHTNNFMVSMTEAVVIGAGLISFVVSKILSGDRK